MANLQNIREKLAARYQGRSVRVRAEAWLNIPSDESLEPTRDTRFEVQVFMPDGSHMSEQAQGFDLDNVLEELHAQMVPDVNTDIPVVVIPEEPSDD